MSNSLITTATTLVNSQHCKLLNIEDLIYHSSEQYLILCLKICNLIVNYKCNINNLIDINKYKQKTINATSTVKSTASTTISTILSTLLSTTPNDTASTLNSTNNNNRITEAIYSNINFYYLDLLNHEVVAHSAAAAAAIIPARISSNSTLTYSSHSSSSAAIPLLLLNLNETECRKYGYRESHKLSLFILGILLSFLILILNGLTLNTIIRTRRLHTITNILIANLSLSDFLSGCSFLYPCILNLLTINALETYNTRLYEIACNIKQYYYICLVGYSPIITSMLSSIFTLTLLAMEKYIAILKPYLYETLCLYKNRLLPLLICFSWLLSIIISLLPIMGWNEYHQTTIVNEKQKILHKSYRGFNCTHPQSMPCMFEKIFTLGFILLFTVICGLCALAMLAIYIRIYIIARKHSKQIALQMTHFNKVHKKQQPKKQTRVNHRNCDDNDDGNDDKVSMKNFKRSSLYRSSTHSDRSHKNYEKLDSNQTTVTTTTTTTTTNSSNNDNTRIHQSITLASYVDIFNETPSTTVTKSQPPELLSSTSSLSISPTQSPIRILKSTTIPPTGTAGTSKSESTYPVSINVKSLNVSMKAMKTLLILLLGFYICWLPLIIYFLTFATQKYNNLTIYILMFVACCNAVIDPIVYAFRNREFYKALIMNIKLKK